MAKVDSRTGLGELTVLLASWRLHLSSPATGVQIKLILSQGSTWRLGCWCQCCLGQASWGLVRATQEHATPDSVAHPQEPTDEGAGGIFARTESRILCFLTGSVHIVPLCVAVVRSLLRDLVMIAALSPTAGEAHH
jgi:hypothetical protein